MRPASPSTAPATRSHKPRAFTVFAAAFVAGAAAAVGVNSLLDVRLAQAKPRVESEPIFVALRSLPQGAPVTVWDVALRDWPRAMVPTSALRASDTFSGLVLRHPLREGQPLLSIQLVESDPTAPSSPVSVTTISTATPPARVPDADLWAPVAPATTTAVTASEQRPQPQAEPQHGSQPQPVAQGPRGPEQAAGTPAVTDAAVAPPVGSPATSPIAAAPTEVAASAPSMQTETIAAETVRPPLAADVAATAGAPVSLAATVAMPATPSPAGPAATTPDETVAGAADTTDDAFTDEILEAMAATRAPKADAFVSQPDDAVIAAPAAPIPSDRGPAQDPAPDRPAAVAAAPGSPTEGAASIPAADAVATQSAPAPTLADPPLAPIAGQTTVGDDATTEFMSVMRPATAGDAPAAVPAPPRVARYLVVPESIALQADASFAAAKQPAPQPAPRSGGTAVQPLPPTGGRQPAPRASQPSRSTSAAASGSGQKPSAPQQTASPQQRRGGMFPNIAAGVDTIDAEIGRLRRGRTGQAEQPASSRSRPQY